MAGERVTSVLHDAVADYLTIRRALGYKLIDHEWMLADFATYLEQAGASTITTELALAWAARTRGNESWKAARLSVVRGFARHLHTIDPTAEIPPTGVLIHRKRPAIPYVYSDAEINRLLGAAEVLTPPPARRDVLHPDRPARRRRHAHQRSDRA